mgnify:FL=1
MSQKVVESAPLTGGNPEDGDNIANEDDGKVEKSKWAQRFEDFIVSWYNGRPVTRGRHKEVLLLTTPPLDWVKILIAFFFLYSFYVVWCTFWIGSYMQIVYPDWNDPNHGDDV